MIDNHSAVRKAHDEDDLLFGTLESWVVYVGLLPPMNACPNLLRRTLQVVSMVGFMLVK